MKACSWPVSETGLRILHSFILCRERVYICGTERTLTFNVLQGAAISATCRLYDSWMQESVTTESQSSNCKPLYCTLDSSQKAALGTDFYSSTVCTSFARRTNKRACIITSFTIHATRIAKSCSTSTCLGQPRPTWQARGRQSNS